MNKRVCIGIPCFNGVGFDVLQDYMSFAYHLGRRYREIDFFLAVKGKSEQFRARNAIVEAALQNACDYLLMLDDDHIIDTSEVDSKCVEDVFKDGRDNYGFLKKLIAHLESDPGKGIVGALYYQRGGDYYPVIMHKNREGNPYFLPQIEVAGRLQQVFVTGGGCMLINMKIFDNIDSPWFAPEFEYGTDIQICKKAIEAGFTVWCDTSIEIGHLRVERDVITSAKINGGHYAS